jgi:hypothetical protein
MRKTIRGIHNPARLEIHDDYYQERTFPLRIPFKPDTRAAASAWGDKDLQVADSLLVKVPKIRPVILLSIVF